MTDKRAEMLREREQQAVASARAASQVVYRLVGVPVLEGDLVAGGWVVWRVEGEGRERRRRWLAAGEGGVEELVMEMRRRAGGAK